MENFDLIEKIGTHLPETLFVLGLLLLIGAITKGNINLGFVQIPELKKPQIIALGALAAGLMIASAIIALKPWESNSRPLAADDHFTLASASTIKLNFLKNDSDPDKDSLSVSIIKHPKKGRLGEVNRGQASYTSFENKHGNDTIVYSVHDGNQGFDTATAIILITQTQVPSITYTSRIVDVFGFPKKGSYQALINGEAKAIILDGRGFFETKAPSKSIGYVPIKGDTLDFVVTNPNIDTLLEYNPIDSIQLVFCKYYDKGQKQAVGAFENIYEIPFEELEIDSTIGTPNKRRLYYGVKIFGPNFSEYLKGKSAQSLLFKIVQIDRQKTIYEPTYIPSGISTTGWNTNGNHGLAKGSYQLTIYSKQEKELEFIEFEIK